MPITRLDYLGRSHISSSCVGHTVYKHGARHSFSIPELSDSEALKQPSQSDPYHFTPYDWAIFGDGLIGNIDSFMLDALEQNGASFIIDSKIQHIFGSILHLAVGRGDFYTTQTMLSQNLNHRRSIKEKWLTMLDSQGRTALHYIAMLRWYENSSHIQAGQFTKIAELLMTTFGDLLKNELNRADKSGLTPYMLAKKYGNKDIVSCFEHYAQHQGVNLEPFHQASHYTKEEIELLQVEGFEAVLATLPNPFGIRPLQIAIMQGKFKEFEGYLKKPPYLMSDLLHEKVLITGNTAYLLAAAHLDNLSEAVEHMHFALTPLDLEQTNQLGQNALHLAVAHLQVNNVKYLLESLPRKSAWVADYLGRTPLHLVALLLPIELGHQGLKVREFLSKQLEIAALLLKAGASVEVRDNFNKSPLEYAKEVGASDLVKILQEEAHKATEESVFTQAIAYLSGWWERDKPALPPTESGDVQSDVARLAPN